MGDNYSIAWRVLDAQYWGVPQRRRRIFLVADFRGQSAGEILFKRDGLSRNFKESCKTWKGITPDSTYRINQSRQRKFDRASRDGNSTHLVIPLDNHPADSRVTLSKDVYRKTSHPLSSKEGQGWEKTLIANTLNVYDNTENRTPVLIVGLDVFNHSTTRDKAKCLLATNQDANNVPCVAITKLTDELLNSIYCASDETFFAVEKDKAPTLKQRDYKTPDYVCIPKETQWIVRRITPTECARLQGMPDWWCKDIPHSDSAEYKMWGNGMALPCALYVMEGIAIELQNEIIDSLEDT